MIDEQVDEQVDETKQWELVLVRYRHVGKMGHDALRRGFDRGAQ